MKAFKLERNVVSDRSDLTSIQSMTAISLNSMLCHNFLSNDSPTAFDNDHNNSNANSSPFQGMNDNNINLYKNDRSSE